MIDRMEVRIVSGGLRIYFPMQLAAKAMCTAEGSLELYVELHSIEPEIWMQMGGGEALGFVRLTRLAELRAGLATYKLTELRPASDPPHSQATFLSLFGGLAPGVYELLAEGKSVVPPAGQRG
jgi:hypothetical protein